MRNVLLIIDPQNDFVDSRGSLYIPNAEKGIDSICEAIDSIDFQQIILTQDTHQFHHIGHSEYWKNKPSPFTTITVEDIRSGLFTPIDKSKEYAIKYIKRLPNKEHCIWPEHCIEGSWGHAFPDKLIKSLHDWSKKKKGRAYDLYKKGQHPDYEMYSAITRADYSGSAHTLSNNPLIKELKEYDKVYISGFAKDVCVAWTVKDLIKSNLFSDKLIFLKDGMVGLSPTSEMLNIFEDAIDNHGAVWE